MERIETLQYIMGAVMEQNRMGNDAFISYSGHVEAFSVRVYEGSFSDDEKNILDDKEPAYEASIYLDSQHNLPFLGKKPTLEEILHGVNAVPVTDASRENLIKKSLDR